jgi:hypoxanthine phosphoribosyltransferase
MSEVPSRPTFAHASEAELARIFDFYAVRWEYEPHVFPLQWNLDGAVVESFSPDFYLPDFELYVELTTLRQPLVRKKNRKLRRLRELYPDVRIKLFYARDFRALMLKYGKGALIGALSGTSGQVVPAVAAEIAEELVAVVAIPPAPPALEPVMAEPVAAGAVVAAPRRRRTRSIATAPAAVVAKPAPEPAA